MLNSKLFLPEKGTTIAPNFEPLNISCQESKDTPLNFSPFI